MTPAIRWTTILTVVVVGILGVASVTLAADVNIGINVGTPVVVSPVAVPVSPPVVVVPPPREIIIEPGVPAYFYAGRYFAYSNGAWFVAEHTWGPWGSVPAERVPRRILDVPRAYEKIPPGHAKKLGPTPWGHGRMERE